jgi:hypothetical protein
MKFSNSSLYYSTDIDDKNTIASITIDEISIQNLSSTDIIHSIIFHHHFFNMHKKIKIKLSFHQLSE